jgi:hypothetical protein
MRNWDADDDGTCPGCGVYMEVIGPPGPRHKEDCPYNGAQTVASSSDRDVSLLADNLLKLRQRDNELKRYFDDVLFKHHGDAFDFEDEF